MKVHCRRRNRAIFQSTLVCSRNFKAKKTLSIRRSNSVSISRRCWNKNGMRKVVSVQPVPGGRSVNAKRFSSVDSQLEKLKAQLADLSSRYTDNYPDVQNTKSQIAKLEAVRDNLITESRVKGKEAKQPDDSSAIRSDSYRSGAADSESIAG